MKFLISKKELIKKIKRNKKNCYPLIAIKHSFSNKNLLRSTKNDCMKFIYFFENSFYKAYLKKAGFKFFFQNFHQKIKRFLQLKWKKKYQSRNFFQKSIEIYFQKIFVFKFVYFYRKKKKLGLYRNRKKSSKENFLKKKRLNILFKEEDFKKKEKINKKIIKVLLKYSNCSNQCITSSSKFPLSVFPLILL